MNEYSNKTGDNSSNNNQTININNYNPNRPVEVETIMKLIEFLTDDNNYKELEKEYKVNPEEKFQNKLKNHAEFFIKEFQYLCSNTNYPKGIMEVKEGLDTIKIERIKNFLIIKSNQLLYEKENNPKEAFDELCQFFEGKIKDRENIGSVAIRFYLLDELIGCNIFSEEIK
jgi:hypothetical protein